MFVLYQIVANREEATVGGGVRVSFSVYDTVIDTKLFAKNEAEYMKKSKNLNC